MPDFKPEKSKPSVYKSSSVEAAAKHKENQEKNTAKKDSSPEEQINKNTPAPSPKSPTPYSASSPARKKKKYYSFFQYPFKTKKQSILVFSIIGVLIVVLLIVAIIASSSKGELSSSLSLESSSALTLVEDADYNPDEFSLSTDQLGHTILGETDEVGESYLKGTLFLGDSNTVRMTMYRDFTYVDLQNSVAVEGMGIQSVTTSACAGFSGRSKLATMPEAVKILQPERIIITFGTNNAGSMGVEKFIENYKQALDAIHTSYPYSEIIIGAVPPIAKQHMNESLSMKAIDQYNLALVELAEEEGYKFINWTEALKDSSTGYAKTGYMLTSDGVHITRTGMEAMFDYIKTHAYITEDDRPKPLTTIPERTGTLSGIVKNDSTGSSSKASSNTSSSRAPSSASQQTQYANVSFHAGEGGYVQVSGGNNTVQVAIGGTAPSATAVANDGYAFSHWTCSVGTLDSSNSTVSGFKVPSSVKAGETVSVSAVFKKIAVPSAPPTPSSAPPPPSEAPASSEAPPVASEPEVVSTASPQNTAEPSSNDI